MANRCGLTVSIIRSSRPKVFLQKGVLEICNKFTGEYPCWSLISIQLLSNFIEITLCHGCSSVNSLHIFRTSLKEHAFLRTSLCGCFCIMSKLVYHYDSKARMIDKVRLEWLLYQQWPRFEQEITMSHDQKTIKSPLLKVH